MYELGVRTFKDLIPLSLMEFDFVLVAFFCADA
jgi:hypothetical protein